MTWHYECGTWSETSFVDDETEKAQDGGTDWEAFLEGIGYRRITGIGDRYSPFEVTVFERNEAPRYLIEIYDGGTGIGPMTAGTLPDALDLMARYAPIAAAVDISSTMADIRSLRPGDMVTNVLASAIVNEEEITATARTIKSARRARREKAQRERKPTP